MNADTLASLQILQTEAHPQSHKQGPTNASSGSKEALSVYGLFSPLARTPQGKDLLRKYFLRPSLDIDLIRMRLNTIEVFVSPENHEPLQSILRSLGQIKNMKKVMMDLRKGVSNGPGKGGGIRNGIWSSLRCVSFNRLPRIPHLLTIDPVCLPCTTNSWRRWPINRGWKTRHQGQGSYIGLQPSTMFWICNRLLRYSIHESLQTLEQ